MATFKAKKLDLTQVNGGQEYEQGDFLQSDTINDVVEGTAYAQNVAEGANTKSDKAVSTANSANKTANDASEKVDEFDERITTAQNKANTAYDNAATAQDTADSATTEINKIKNGTTVVPNANHANDADNADMATKAQQDVNGNSIVDTYATKNEVAEKQGTKVYYGSALQPSVAFDSDPQTQISEAQSDINDIIDGSQTVGKAKQDANGNVINTTYAKLTQVVRVDAAQSLTDAQKNTVAQNIERSAGRNANNGVGWYNILTANTTGYFVADLSVTSSYSNQDPTEVKIIAIGGYTVSGLTNTRASITCFSAGALSPFISKVRVRSLEDQICIDIYIPYNTTVYSNNMQVTINSWKDINNATPQVQPFTFVVGEAPAADSVSICEVIQNGINTTGTIYQQGAPVFATDLSKLVPSTANGWTQTTATGTLPSAGVYMIAFNHLPSGSQPTYYNPAVLIYDGTVGSCTVTDGTGALLTSMVVKPSGIQLVNPVNIASVVQVTNIYYKRIA